MQSLNNQHVLKSRDKSAVMIIIITDAIHSFQSNKFPTHCVAYSSISNNLVETLLSVDTYCNNNDNN